MYADTNRGSMPWSAHMGRATGPFGFISNNSPENTMTLRVGLLDRTPRVGAGWDGLGGLYEDHYLRAPEVFYCPSHKGFHGYDKYAANWHDENVSIVGNFQYRALSPRGDRLLSSLADRNLALLSDGLRTQEDFSHKRGANVLRADMSVFWFVDPLDTFSSGLADGEGAVSSSLVESAWSKLDAAAQGN